MFSKTAMVATYSQSNNLVKGYNKMNQVQKWQKIADNRLTLWQRAKQEKETIIDMLELLVAELRAEPYTGDLTQAAYSVAANKLESIIDNFKGDKLWMIK